MVLAHMIGFNNKGDGNIHFADVILVWLVGSIDIIVDLLNFVVIMFLCSI